MKYINKINIIIILVFVVSIIFSNNVQAIGNIFQEADEFLGEGKPVSSTINTDQLQETSDFIYKLLLAIGIIVMFIVGTIIGIKFMVSSAEDKAKVKEALVPYVVGCVVIFGGFTIWSTAVNIGQEIQGEGSTTPMSGRETLKYQCKNIYCFDIFTIEEWEHEHGRECPSCGLEAGIEYWVVCGNCQVGALPSSIRRNEGYCPTCGAGYRDTTYVTIGVIPRK